MLNYVFKKQSQENLSSGQQGHNVIFYMSQDNINIKQETYFLYIFKETGKYMFS